MSHAWQNEVEVVALLLASRTDVRPLSAGNTGGGLALTGTAGDALKNTLSVGANTFRNNTVGRLLLLPVIMFSAARLQGRMLDSGMHSKVGQPACHPEVMD